MQKNIIKTISLILVILFSIFSISPNNSSLTSVSTVYADTITTFEDDYIIANNEGELIKILTDKLYDKEYNIKIKLYGETIDLSSVIESIVYNNEYLKCEIDSVNTYYSIYENPKHILYTFKISYVTTKEQDEETDIKIKEILDSIITPNMYTYEKVKAVNDYIVGNFEYDLTFTNYSDYDLLFTGRSVCNGYALLTYKMLKALNIPVVLVTGKADSGDGNGYFSHAWNMVNIGGYWFNIDTTWNDPTPDRKGVISYNYYLKSDAVFEVDHKPDNVSHKPSTTKEYSVYLDEFNTNLDKYISMPTTDNIKIKIHDSYIDFSKYNSINLVEPFIENGRTLVPIRAVFSELGYDVKWNVTTKTATISNSNNNLTIRPNDMYATINGQRVNLDVPAKIVNGSIVVPVRFISEAFGNIVFWDSEDKTVIIY